MGTNVHGITLDDAKFSVQNAAGDFVEVPGVANFASAGGEATPNIQRYYGGNLVLTGSTNPGTVTVDDIAVTPLHESYSLVRAAVASRGQLIIGLETDPATRILGKSSGRECAIGTDADCTITGLGDEDFRTEKYGINNVIVIGANSYAINSITGSGATKGDVKVFPAPSADVPAAEFEVVLPKLIFRPIAVKVLNSTTLNMNAPADGALNGTLTLQLLGDLPTPTVDTTISA